MNSIYAKLKEYIDKIQQRLNAEEGTLAWGYKINKEWYAITKLYHETFPKDKIN